MFAGQSDDFPDPPEATDEQAGNMVDGRPLITKDRLLSSTLTMFIEEFDACCCGGDGCGGICKNQSKQNINNYFLCKYLNMICKKIFF